MNLLARELAKKLADREERLERAEAALARVRDECRYILSTTDYDVAAEEPLSIQTNIATLSHELNLAEAALAKIRTIHRPDPTSSWCVHCNWEWPCRTYIYSGGGA